MSVEYSCAVSVVECSCADGVGMYCVESQLTTADRFRCASVLMRKKQLKQMRAAATRDHAVPIRSGVGVEVSNLRQYVCCNCTDGGLLVRAPGTSSTRFRQHHRLEQLNRVVLCPGDRSVVVQTKHFRRSRQRQTLTKSKGSIYHAGQWDRILRIIFSAVSELGIKRASGG